MNNSRNKLKKRFVLSDLMVILIFFSIVFLMFLRSARSNTLYNSCKNPSELNSIIQLETRNTFLENGNRLNWWDKVTSSFTDALSGTTFTNHLLLYFNPKYPLTVNCSSCFETEPCEEDQIEPFFYPKQITLNHMNAILKTLSGNDFHAIFIQSSTFEQFNLPFPVQYCSLFGLVDAFQGIQKEVPVFILGSTYLETRIASETLVRAGFKRVYRVITLLHRNQDT